MNSIQGVKNKVIVQIDDAHLAADRAEPPNVNGIVGHMDDVNRAEHLIMVCGTTRVTRNDEVSLRSMNQSTHTTIDTKRQLEKPAKVSLVLIEVQYAGYLW